VRIASRWEAVHEITSLTDRDRHWLVQRSRDRILLDPHRFGRLFYEALFRERPEIAPLFANVDMVRMREMLLHMHDQAVQRIDDLPSLAGVLRDLGARHVGYGVQTEYYPVARRALLEALVGFFGDEVGTELQGAWADMFDVVISLMLEGGTKA
jgi:hemoglobin-like flavoprotein